MRHVFHLNQYRSCFISVIGLSYKLLGSGNVIGSAGRQDALPAYKNNYNKTPSNVDKPSFEY